MATYPLTSLAARVTASGVEAPTYADILASLQASYRLIFGDDIYVEPDSQDGQLVSIFALAMHDANQAFRSAYNAYSPQTAVGEGLSNAVKLNHIARRTATKSQVNLTLVGQAGATISEGMASDGDGNRWVLPAVVTIPPNGTVIVTAQAEFVGAVNAPAGTVTNIATPALGWQTVTNVDPATPGQPVETDAELRARQELSPALRSYTVLAGLTASLKAIDGVTYGTVYENDTGAADANGLPPHSIACVVKGGDASLIAQTIYARKTPGAATHGTTTVPVTDVSGALKDIKFFVPTEVPIKVAISLQAMPGYTSAIGDRIKNAVVDFGNKLDIGEDVIITRLFAPALLFGDGAAETYKITVIQAGLSPAGALGSADLVIAFTAKATFAVSAVTITVV